jgi:nucleotide-binding universal stress UspA family protein
MSIKRILIPIPNSLGRASEIDMGMSAAKALGAHVEALFIREPPPAIRGGVSASAMRYAGYGSEAVAMSPAHAHAEEQDKQAREAREQFAQTCAAHGIPMLGPSDDPGSPLAASWREAEGSYVEIVTQRAAAFDLLVAASAAVMESLMNIAEESLLRTRRPVLLAPSHLETRLTDVAMIAWDESPECWHAVSASIPFLKLARAVEVVSVDRHVVDRQASQEEALAYLRCHGIGATARVVAPHLRSVGDTLLAVAGESNVGLMVMGAYSHSRLREVLLGGATRHILKNAAARPVLMAH